MDREFVLKTVKQLFFAALFGAVFSLVCLAVAALFVKNFSTPQAGVSAINWSVKCVAAFLGSALFVRGERALFKGAGAGALFVVLTMFLFAVIGGGLHIDGFFVLELIVCAILGGAGGLLGAKLRKA